MALTYVAKEQFAVATPEDQPNRVISKGDSFAEGDPILGKGFGSDASIASGRGREKLFEVRGESSRKGK